VRLNKSIEVYVKLFEKKHDIYFEFWVADLTGTIACFSNEYYIDFNDIRFDLENEIDKKQFLEWYDVSLDLALEGKQTINYKTWNMRTR